MKIEYGSENSEVAKDTVLGAPREIHDRWSMSYKAKAMTAAAASCLLVGGAVVLFDGRHSMDTTVMAVSSSAAANNDLSNAWSTGEEFMIRLSGENLCFDDGGGYFAGQTQFTSQPCNPRSPNQLFVYNDQTSQIRSARKNNLCIDDGSDHAPSHSIVSMANCDTNSGTQGFVFDASSGVIQNPSNSHKSCINPRTSEIPSQSIYEMDRCSYVASQARVEFVSPKEDLEKQQAMLDSVSAGHKIMLRAGGKDLCVGNEDTMDGRLPLKLWTCDSNNPSQIFTWDGTTHHLMTVPSAANPNQLCVDVSDRASTGYFSFGLKDCDPASQSQSFEFDPENVLIRDVNDRSMCMDDDGTTTSGEKEIVWWDCYRNNPNQHIEPILLADETSSSVPLTDTAALPDLQTSTSNPLKEETAQTWSQDALVSSPSAWVDQSSAVSYADQLPSNDPNAVPVSPDADELYASGELANIPIEAAPSSSYTASEGSESNGGLTTLGEQVTSVNSELPVPDPVVAYLVPQELPAQPEDPAVQNPVIDMTIFNSTFHRGNTTLDTGDWNLLAPSNDTIDSVNIDSSTSVSSNEIFEYLQGIKDRAEEQYAITMYKYDRTLKCVSAGLQKLAKTDISADEYHVLVRWMYAHCAAGNADVDKSTMVEPLGPDDISRAPAVAPLVNDSSSDIDRMYMSKLEFYYEIKNHFAGDRAKLFADADNAHLRSEVQAASHQKLDDCIHDAAKMFGYSDGSYVNMTDHFEAATKWINEECLNV